MARYNKNKAINYRESLLMTRDIANSERFEKLFTGEVDISSIKKDLSNYDKAVDYVDKHVYKGLNACFGGKQASADSDVNVLLRIVVENKNRADKKAKKLRSKAKPNILLEKDVKVYEDAEMILNRIVNKRFTVMSILKQLSELEETVNTINSLKSDIKSLRKQIESRENANTNGTLDSELNNLRNALAAKANAINVALDKRYTINFYLRKTIGNLSTFVKDYKSDLAALNKLFGGLKSGKDGNTTIGAIALQGINHRISRMTKVCDKHLLPVAQKQIEINRLYKTLGIMPNNASKRVNDRLRTSQSTPAPATTFANTTGNTNASTPSTTTTRTDLSLQRITDRFAYINRNGQFYIYDGDQLVDVTDQNGLDNFIATKVLGVGNSAVFTAPNVYYSYSMYKDGKVAIFKNGELFKITDRTGLDEFKRLNGVDVAEIVAPSPVKTNQYSYLTTKDGRMAIFQNDEFYKFIRPDELDNFIQTIGAPVTNISPENSTKESYYYYIDKNGKAFIFQGEDLYKVTDQAGLYDFMIQNKDNISKIMPAGSKVDVPVQQVVTQTQTQPVVQNDVNVEMMAAMLGVSLETASKVVGLYNAKSSGLIDEDTFNTAKDAILGVNTKKDSVPKKTKKSPTKKNTSKKTDTKTVKENKQENVIDSNALGDEQIDSNQKANESNVIEAVNNDLEESSLKGQESISSLSSVEFADTPVSEQTEESTVSRAFSNIDIDPEKYEMVKNSVAGNETVFESDIKDMLGCDMSTACAYFDKLVTDGIVSNKSENYGEVVTPQNEVEETKTEQKPDPWVEGPNDYGVIGSIVEDKPDPTIPNDPRIFEEPIYKGSEVKDSASVEPVAEEKTEVVEQPVAEEVKSEINETEIIPPVVEEAISQPAVEEVKQTEVPVQEEIKEPEVVSQPEVTPAPVEPVVEQTPAFVAPVETPVKETVEQEGPTPEIVTEVPAEFTAPINLEEELKTEQSAPASTERPALEPSDFARNPLSDSPSPVAEVEELINHEPSVVPDEEVQTQTDSIEQNNVSKVEAAAPTSTAVFGGALGKVQQGIRDWLAQQDLNNPKLTDGGHNR